MSALASRHAASTSIVRTGTSQPRVHPLVHALALVLLAGNASAATFNAGNQNQLIEAINNANANAGEDRIRLTSDVVLSAALPTITDALIIDGTGDQRKIKRNDSGPNACSATATNAFRLIDATADLTLRDLKLTGGCNQVDQGGALRVQGAALRVERCKISGNQTFVENPNYAYGQGGIGGGIAVLSGSATLVDSTLSGNSTHGNFSSGGGVAVYNSDLEVRRSTISGNLAGSSNLSAGGGVYAVGDYANAVPRTVTIRNSSVSGNSSEGDTARGGGLAIYSEMTTITDSLIDGNHVIGGYDGRSGGLSIFNGVTPFADVTIDRTTVSANTVVSDGEGGAGLFISGVNHFTLNASSVIGNASTNTVFCRGGGIDLANVGAVVTDSTISGNTIDSPFGRGGGIFIYSESDFPTSLSVYNSTIANNIVTGYYNRGGGVRFQSHGNYDGAHDSIPPTGFFESTIISGNVAETGSAIQIKDSPVVANNSLIQGTVEINPNQGGTFTPDAVTIALFGQDPLLRPLADNGGPTLTHALPCGSPANSAGSNVTGLRFDQRDHGFPRRAGHAVDIGAVETDCRH